MIKRHHMKILLGLVVLAVAVFSFMGCMGYSLQTTRAYNALGRSVHLDLKYNGYIIGMEKYKRRDIHIKKSDEPHYQKRFCLKPVSNTNPLTERQNKEFKNILGDPRAIVITQISSYFPALINCDQPGDVDVHVDGRTATIRVIHYNAYESDCDGSFDYFEGFDDLDKLSSDMASRLNKAFLHGEPYTHVMVMSMGWNNDQHESIMRYNELLKQIDAAHSIEEKFKPLVIGFTWPSAWFTISDSAIQQKVIGHFLSYFTKNDDADEIGYTVGNWLINKMIPDLAADYSGDRFPKVVVIGHSMGARLLSRAVFSSDHLKIKPEKAHSPDIFIGLGSAFSARRFIEKDSGESAPYVDYMDLKTKIVLVSSWEDSANCVPIWSQHAGGKRGIKYMRKNPGVFREVSWERPADIRDAFANYHMMGKVILLNASNIVTGVTPGSPPLGELSAHNDYYDEDMGKLVWFCIKP